MRCIIPEISWHNREPVLSVDIHPVHNDFYRLASGGGDSHVLIWQMNICDNGSVKQEVISDLTRHQKAVNIVRWSSSGQYLASADDDANIIVWQLKNDNIPLLEDETDDKEIWIVHKVLRGHKEDVYDLCWSVDNLKLLTGSIDNTAILWDLTKGKMDHILSDHKGFVQGVAWDPKGDFIATISTDRVCRLFDVTGKQVKARIHKGKLPVPPGHYLYDTDSKYFHDDTFKSFFRRLHFTPDGSLLIVPSGHIQVDDCKKTMNATLMFTMDNWNEPVAVLPLPAQCSTVVRCCPILFQHHDNGPEPVVKLPYRMVFAIGADHDVILYDTQQAAPFARFHDIHYTRLTDLTWSSDGRLLIASSTDGFCTLITFEAGELGIEYVEKCSDSDVEEDVSNGLELLVKDENIDINNKVKEKEVVEARKKPSFIAQWVRNTPKKKARLDVEEQDSIESGVIEIRDDDEDDVGESLDKEIKMEINRLIPRRASSLNVATSTEVCAKPIEVRRKPREVMEAQPIEVRRKPKVVETTGGSAETLDRCLKKEDAEEHKNVVKETGDDDIMEVELEPKDTISEKKLNASNETSTKNVANSDETKGNRRKKDTPKIKIGSLARKKLNTNTPPKNKNNPLLNFLKSPVEKKDCRVGSSAVEIDLTADAEEAMNAWSKQSKSKMAASAETTPLDIEEDCTEDFSLQLEDSQEAADEKRRRNDVPSVSSSSSLSVVIDDGDNAVLPTQLVGDNVTHKVPRRVAFITLSSPKDKKKQSRRELP